MIPTPRQACLSSMERFQGDSVWIGNIQHDTLENNRCFLFIVGNSGVTISSITDNQGNTWVQLMTPVVAGQSGHIWTTVAKARTRTITITIGASDTFMQFAFVEMPYTSTLVVASALSGTPVSTTGQTGTTISGGSITPTVNGCAIFHFVFDRTQTQLSTFAAGSGFTLLAGQVRDGCAIQYQIQQTAGAVTPSLTRTGGAGANYNTMTFAILPDPSAGEHTLRAGMRFLQHQNVQPSPTSVAFQFPSKGTGLVLTSFQGLPDNFIASVSDSNSNNWTKAIDHSVATTGNGRAEIWYAEDARTSEDLIITVTMNAAFEHSMILFYDMVGMRRKGMLGALSDKANGSQSVNADLATCTITPLGKNSIVISAGGIFSHTARSLGNGVGKWFPHMWTDPASDGANITLQEADCFGAYLNETDLSATTFVWQIQNNIGGTGTWACVAAEFLVEDLGASSGPTPIMSIVNEIWED